MADQLILDTHILIWFVAGDQTLKKKTKSFLDEAFMESRFAVSSISFWEIALLLRRNKIKLDQPLNMWRRKVLL